MDLEGWKEIDAILDSERFIALRRVVLYAVHPSVDYGTDDPKLSEQLHSLNSKGILHVHSSKVRHIHHNFGHTHVEMYIPAPSL